MYSAGGCVDFHIVTLHMIPRATLWTVKATHRTMYVDRKARDYNVDCQGNPQDHNVDCQGNPQDCNVDCERNPQCHPVDYGLLTHKPGVVIS